MSDEVIEILRTMQIKNYYEGNDKVYVFNKLNLINFCIKMMEVIKKYEE